MKPTSMRGPPKGFQPSADADQLSLIGSSHSTIRLIAPAGSGKTQTIVTRVLHPAKGGAKPERLLCLTFDNSAAQALRGKIAEHLAGTNVLPANT